MLEVILSTLLATGSPAPEPAGAPPTKARAAESPNEALLREAQALRYSQRWYEAAQRYRTFLAQTPESDKSPIARFYLASVLERDQRWDEAAAAYTDFLQRHSDQRSLGKEARLSRIRCWGIRQGQSPEATPGLLAALQDGDAEVRVNAALQLAKVMDRQSIPGLREGLAMSSYADRCTMALVAFGEKPAAPRAQEARFLVVRIQEQGKKDAITLRLSLILARAVGSYLSDEQVRQVRKKGIELESLGDHVQSLPKGSLLFSVQDAKSSVTVTVE